MEALHEQPLAWAAADQWFAHQGLVGLLFQLMGMLEHLLGHLWGHLQLGELAHHRMQKLERLLGCLAMHLCLEAMLLQLRLLLWLLLLAGQLHRY